MSKIRFDVERYQPLYTPIAILLGGLAVAAAIFVSGGLGGSPNVAGEANLPTDSGEPQILEVSVDDDPVLGSADAPVTIIEFSDFQCPYCRIFWSDALPQIKSEYIDKGLARLVYRDLPLTSIGHEMAQPYAEAAECADDQGKFWEMHDKIFEEQAKKGTDTITSITLADVKNWARDIGLDGEGFDQCLSSGKYTDEVNKETSDAQRLAEVLTPPGIGTPTFFIGKSSESGTIEGQLISGAQPFTSFQQVIDGLLSD